MSLPLDIEPEMLPPGVRVLGIATYHMHWQGLSLRLPYYLGHNHGCPVMLIQQRFPDTGNKPKENVERRIEFRTSSVAMVWSRVMWHDERCFLPLNVRLTRTWDISRVCCVLLCYIPKLHTVGKRYVKRYFVQRSTITPNVSIPSFQQTFRNSRHLNSTRPTW